MGWRCARGRGTLSIVAFRPPIDVFDYLDYRAYLRDYYEAKKAEGRGFSFRAFSKSAGLGAPNHLKRVMEGERNLTPEMAVRFAETLGLKDEGTRYFIDLVAFNQAKRGSERDAAYHRLTGSRGYRKAQRIDVAHAAYHSTWYLPAIREMVIRQDFSEDPQWIAERLWPTIRPYEAQRALATLLELGLLRRDESGKLVQGETVVTTGAETRGLHIRTYHKIMMERAAEAMEIVPSPLRDMSALTFCVGEDGLRKIKQRIQRFRQEIIALCAEEQHGEQVVQLNMQLFPLTTRRSDEETP